MTKRVLVVDDEAHITEVISMKLRRSGYDVTTAGDGEEALSLALGEPFELIIADYQMPRMSGFELGSRLREHECTREVPVLMITARGHMLTDEELAETNIRMLLPKPFGPRNVLACVEDLIGPASEEAGARAA